MSASSSRTSPATRARIAGAVYMLVIVASVFALYSSQSLIVRGDAAATAARIMASEQAFRIAFASNLVACLAYVAVVAILYEVMRPAGRTLSIVAAFFGLVGCAVSGATMLNQLAALAFLGDASYLAAFETAQLQALARVSLRLGGLGNSLSLAFFGCYCLSLAALVVRATFLPRFLAALLAIAGLGWITNAFVTFLAPQVSGVSAMTMAAGGLGEGLFTLWLLAMGVNATTWREQAGTA